MWYEQADASTRRRLFEVAFREAVRLDPVDQRVWAIAVAASVDVWSTIRSLARRLAVDIISRLSPAEVAMAGRCCATELLSRFNTTPLPWTSADGLCSLAAAVAATSNAISRSDATQLCEAMLPFLAHEQIAVREGCVCFFVNVFKSESLDDAGRHNVVQHCVRSLSDTSLSELLGGLELFARTDWHPSSGALLNDRTLARRLADHHAAAVRILTAEVLALRGADFQGVPMDRVRKFDAALDLHHELAIHGSWRQLETAGLLLIVVCDMVTEPCLVNPSSLSETACTAYRLSCHETFEVQRAYKQASIRLTQLALRRCTGDTASLMVVAQGHCAASAKWAFGWFAFVRCLVTREACLAAAVRQVCGDGVFAFLCAAAADIPASDVDLADSLANLLHMNVDWFSFTVSELALVVSHVEPLLDATRKSATVALPTATCVLLLDALKRLLHRVVMSDVWQVDGGNFATNESFEPAELEDGAAGIANGCLWIRSNASSLIARWHATPLRVSECTFIAFRETVIETVLRFGYATKCCEAIVVKFTHSLLLTAASAGCLTSADVAGLAVRRLNCVLPSSTQWESVEFHSPKTPLKIAQKNDFDDDEDGDAAAPSLLTSLAAVGDLLECVPGCDVLARNVRTVLQAMSQ